MQYWDNRYKNGGSSGAGSYGRLARFKAEILNTFVTKNHVNSVLEFGCGDGEQLALADYPRYIGVDVSEYVIDHCRLRFNLDTSKAFYPYILSVVKCLQQADLTLSLDVIYHLVEDEVFTTYMYYLFSKSEKYVIIYSSNVDKTHPAAYIRHRRFTDWIQENSPEWRLKEIIENRYPADVDSSFDDRSFAQFYIFQRDGTQPNC